MSWGRGLDILVDTWTGVRDFVPDDRKAMMLSKICKTFWNADCDTLYELTDCGWPEAVEALVMCGYIRDCVQCEETATLDSQGICEDCQ